MDEVNGAAAYAEGAYVKGGSDPGYNKGNGTGYVLSHNGNTFLFYIESKIYTKYYRFRDRSLVYTYYFSREEQKKSDSLPSGENIFEVQEWVKYRVR